MAATAFQVANTSPIAQPLNGQFQQVGAGQTATLKIPQGATYASISILCGIGGALAPIGAGTAPSFANLQSMLTLWTMYLNGTPVWSLTGTQLYGIMNYYMPGLIAADGVVTIVFSRLWMKDIIAMLAPDWGTLDQSSVQLNIQQDATSTITNMDAWAQVEPQSEPLGRYVTYNTVSSTFGAGRQSFTLLYKDPSAVMYNLFIQVPTFANLTRVELWCDNVPVFDGPPIVNQKWGQLGTPQRGTASLQALNIANIDFCQRGIDADALPLNMSTLVLWLTFSVSPGATAINMIQEVAVGNQGA